MKINRIFKKIKNNIKHVFDIKWKESEALPLLFYVAFALCFIFFPAFLLNSILYSINFMQEFVQGIEWQKILGDELWVKISTVAAIATVIGIFLNFWAIKQTMSELKEDRAEREEAREYQAWANLTNSNISGPNKMEALEYLHRKGQSFEGLILKKGTKLSRIEKQAKRIRRKISLDLQGADLRRIEWREVDLKGAHLEDACLWGAHLEGANLDGAYLEGTDLTNAHLEGASLSKAHLSDADLWGVHLEGAYLSGADMKNSKNLPEAEVKKACSNKEDGRKLPSLPKGMQGPQEMTYDKCLELRKDVMAQIKVKKRS